MSIDDRIAALGRVIAKAREFQCRTVRQAAENEARADHLNDLANAVMAAREAADQMLATATERLALADAAHDANAKWEADLSARESRLAHPANQPPEDAS